MVGQTIFLVKFNNSELIAATLDDIPVELRPETDSS